MKKAALLIALLFILSACQSRTPAPAEVLPTPSRTPSPTVTPTPNATERYQGTLQANQTQNAGYALTQVLKQTEFAQTQAVKALTPTSTPTITPTDTPFPTWTPQPTSTPLPTVVPPQNVFSAYKLRDPNPETLVELTGQLLVQRNLVYDYPLEYQNVEALAQVVNFEWEQRYLGLNFDPSLLIPLEKIDEYSWYSWYRPEFWFDYLAGATTDYFNQNAIELVNGKFVSTPYFNAKIYLVELDHDSEPEWLVWSEFEKIKSGVWVTLEQISSGQYIRLANEIEVRGGVGSPDYELYRLQDFTGDGLSDAIILWNAYFGGGTRAVQFQFLKGTPNGFKLVFEVLEDKNTIYDEIDYDWLEIENSNPILRMSIMRYWGWCYKTTSREFFWQGDDVKEKPVTPWPESVDCAIAAATWSDWSPPANQTTIDWLETALEMDAVNPQLSTETQVFIHYRLALSYALIGNDFLSRQNLEFIITLALTGTPPIASNLAEKIQPLLSENKVDPYKLCMSAEELSLGTSVLGLSGYSLAMYEGLLDGYPTSLCHSPQKIQEIILSGIKLDPPQSIENTLESAGFAVSHVESFKLNQSEQGWLIFLEDENTYSFSSTTGWHFLGHYPYNSEISLINQDLTGDGQPEIALIERGEIGNYLCELDQIQYYFLLISSIGHNLTIPVKGATCYSAIDDFDPVTFFQDQSEDGLVDWLENEYFVDYDLGLLEKHPASKPIVFNWENTLKSIAYKPDLLASLDNQFFTSPTPSLLRPDLEFYRARWGTGDDPTSEQIYAHLTYLLALTYELEGDETQAVERFYDIWANHPDTLWAYLAAARLELK